MSSSQNPLIVRHERTQAPYSKPNRPKPFSWNGRSTVLSQLPRKDGSHNQSGCPPTDQPDYPMMNLAAFWQQMLPSMPVLPVYPTRNHCIVNNLASDPHHGIEEVSGSNQNRRSDTAGFAVACRPSSTLINLPSKAEAARRNPAFEK